MATPPLPTTLLPSSSSITLYTLPPSTVLPPHGGGGADVSAALDPRCGSTSLANPLRQSRQFLYVNTTD
nr:hypothetical protein Iba_chr05aCG3520 [Ipomoea batatas]